MVCLNSVIFFNVAKSKQDILEQLDKFKERQEKEIQDAIMEVDTSSRDIETQIASIVHAINQSFHELQEILDLHKEKLLVEASQLHEEKLKRLVHQKEKLERRMSVILARVAEKKENVKDATGDSLEAVQDQVSIWMDSESGEKLTDLVPVEEADMTVEINVGTQELRQMCETIKIVTNLVDPSKCTVEGFENMKTVEINVPFVVKLHVASVSGKPQSKPVNVEAKLRSCVDRSLMHTVAGQKQGSTYTIECTPLIRGQHQLNVTVNGLEVLGSPFRLFVRIPPDQLGKPLKIIDGLNGPTGIAFNSAGELLVAEFNGGVVVLDKDGRKVRRIERHGQNHHFEQPWGVAVDADDNIYVTDQESKRIYKFNKDLELMTHNIMKENKCFGVVVVGERVIVIEKLSKNLEIFTRNLKFIKVIEISSEGCSLTFDKCDSKLYVCDSISHRIKVFNDQCEYLYSIGDKPGLGLQIPHFVCIDGDLVFVTEYEAHCVSIFTKQGEYVRSFGHMGSGEGQFDHPYGIAQDSNGFLYVSDRVNNRLQVF